MVRQARKEIIIYEMIQKWFEGRETLSKRDFEMINEMYWLVKK